MCIGRIGRLHTACRKDPTMAKKNESKKSDTKKTTKKTTKSAAEKPKVAKRTAAKATPAKTETASKSGKPAKPKATRGKKSVDGAMPVPVITLSHDQISARAFLIWEAKGRPDGQDYQNWQEAEQQLRDEMARGS
jgi:L,D-peptidoglycan transpeptidase YkuD (ErfK/YbiS/YcfS/YnhG family)